METIRLTKQRPLEDILKETREEPVQERQETVEELPEEYVAVRITLTRAKPEEEAKAISEKVRKKATSRAEKVAIQYGNNLPPVRPRGKASQAERVSNASRVSAIVDEIRSRRPKTLREIVAEERAKGRVPVRSADGKTITFIKPKANN